ncbi:hypothetical protein V8F33_005857 [Rhypophila sp. PSN 637]
MAGHKAVLLGMPQELLLKIFRGGVLDHADWKALRLTCRQLACGPTITYLFHTIGISRFRRDVDAFIAIGSAPHLAAQVKVIVFHELLSNAPAYRTDLTPTDTPDWLLSFDQDARDTIRRQVLSFEWTAYSLYEDNHHYPDVVPLRSLFKAADSMPGVHTLVSRPMSLDRPLTSPQTTDSYPLTAQNLLGDYFEFDRKSTGHWNRGFLEFLLPLAATRPADHPISRLCISDEGHYRKGPAMRERGLFLRAFQNLSHFDVCLSHRQSIEIIQLAEYLRAARKLQSLYLCGEKDCSKFGVCHLLCGILFGRMIVDYQPRWMFLGNMDRDFRWANLRELKIAGCDQVGYLLGVFIPRHAHCLKTVRLSDCKLNAEDLRYIASNVPPAGLNMEHFTILLPEDGDADIGFEDFRSIATVRNPLVSAYLVGERQLVEFLNAPFRDGCPLSAEIQTLNDRRLIYTHIPIFDSRETPSHVVCETRGRCDIVSGVYDLGEIKALDKENGDIRDHEGYSYMEGTDFSPFEKIHQVDDDDDTEDEGEEMTDGNWEHQPESLDDEKLDDGLRWVVARDPNRDIYYWQEKEHDADIQLPDSTSPYAEYTSRKYKTEVWRFTHRTGETALGREPLEYWEDWEGQEAGDVAEALPVGYTMRAFINQTAKPSMTGPEFECSSEYIKAKGGIKYELKEGGQIPWLDDSLAKEAQIFQEYVNRNYWVDMSRERLSQTARGLDRGRGWLIVFSWFGIMACVLCCLVWLTWLFAVVLPFFVALVFL